MAKRIVRGVSWFVLIAAGVIALATLAKATNYSLWINGRTGGGQLGNHADFSYWGPANVNAGVNKKSVNWDGYNHVSDQNFLVRDALDCYCTGKNWCYVAVHSAGDLQIGYSLALYGGTTRMVKNATPNGQGQCGNLDGSTQTGWNLKWVDVAGGAAGGSELANAGDWAIDEPLVSDLKTGTARAMYDHSSTRAIWFYMYAGANGTAYSFVLPGQDDEAIAYHSSGGVSGSGGASFCNPSDWFCNDLTLGTTKNEGGRAKWGFHSVAFRDNGENYNHYTNGNWAGIVSRVRADMEAKALSAPMAGVPQPADRRAERALWEQRLARAQRTLESYRIATRYPHESRPLAEHPDQVRPNRAIVEERPLRLPGGPVVDGLLLRTTQERVFVQGDESVLITVAAVDGEGRVQPLQVARAFAHEGATGLAGSRVAAVPVQFSDDGRQGDAAAGDGTFSLRLQPSRVGFAELDGLIRVELALQSGDQPGFAYFDVIHSAGKPATWGPGAVHEAVEAGSLNLYLPVQVLHPGRYVVTGRIDDANGRPFALVNFNDELGAGPQQIRLQVFGKLLRDVRPAFPLSLRDVDAFLLKPDAFPDRSLMPRRDGLVYQTRSYPLVAFSDAEWPSAERQRYLDDYAKDVSEAEGHLRSLGP